MIRAAVDLSPCSVGLPPRADSSSRTRQEPRATKTSLYIPITPRMHRIADALNPHMVAENILHIDYGIRNLYA